MTQDKNNPKLKMHSPDLTQDNIAKLAELFPNCVTESRDEQGQIKQSIDFDQLRQELSGNIVEGPQERYHINWPGKREALLNANAPVAKTMRPYRDESVDFDTTKNLFIEGDNLEALKLLQETYLGKVKIIYIDPPYNTGNDFIYNDGFSEESSEFLKRSNQVNEIGHRLVSNTEASGRFHSDWLSMMYSRIRVARNLLKEDGVIFISIDDGECYNLKKACDEIFGERNFIADIIWQKKFSRSNDATYFSTMHDHILCYAKKAKWSGAEISWELALLPRGDEIPDGYSNPDNDSRGPWTSVVLSAKSGTDKLVYEIETPSGRRCLPPSGRYWSVTPDRFKELVEDNRIWFGKNGDGIPRLKTFLSEVQDGLRPNTIWSHKDVGHNQEGRQEVKKLFDDKGLYDSPKPVRLIKTILRLASKDPEFIAMDFFAGSSTTAHAILNLNSEDGGNRKFIMVQLPEPCDENSEAFKEGYKTIADISKERIRRAAKKINEQSPASKIDSGFRTLKVETSNMKDVYYTPDQVTQRNLFGQIDNIKENRTDEDLLFQVLVDWGVDLTLPIHSEVILNKTVYFVDQDALAACFEADIDREFVKKLAEKKPLRVVFRDTGFSSDSTKINVEQIFKLISPTTEVKTI